MVQSWPWRSEIPEKKIFMQSIAVKQLLLYYFCHFHQLEISLFTNIPIKYILEEIYTHNRLPNICSKLIFKRLLLKLATESTYIFQFYTQTDGCTMGGPLLVTFSNINLTKLGKDQVKPLKRKFYRRFVNDV